MLEKWRRRRFESVPSPPPDKLKLVILPEPAANPATHLVVPSKLPFLESLSWFDTRWRDLPPFEMLQRYERGWRHRGVTAEPSAEEMVFVRMLAQRFGSVLDVPA